MLNSLMLYEGQIWDWYRQQRGFGFEMWLNIMKTVWNKKINKLNLYFFFVFRREINYSNSCLLGYICSLCWCTIYITSLCYSLQLRCPSITSTTVLRALVVGPVLHICTGFKSKVSCCEPLSRCSGTSLCFLICNVAPRSKDLALNL